jgi:hypothetical protein
MTIDTAPIHAANAAPAMPTRIMPTCRRVMAQDAPQSPWGARRRALSRPGHRGSARQALRRFLRPDPNAVELDESIPGMDMPMNHDDESMDGMDHGMQH